MLLCLLQYRMLVSRTGLRLRVCPCNVFNGPSTHSTSLVRMMLITVQHLATLSRCSSHIHLHTQMYMCTCTHINIQSDARKLQGGLQKMRASKQAECKCKHKQISSTWHAMCIHKTYRFTHTCTHTPKKNKKISRTQCSAHFCTRPTFPLLSHVTFL